MLADLTALLRREVEAAGLYAAVPGPETGRAVAAADLHTYLWSCNGCERRIAEALGADRVMTGRIRKVSRLLSSLQVRIVDVRSGRELYLRGFDFRGDTDAAWHHAARYMVRALVRARAAPGPAAPTD
jgi:hypothetical protein